jgi:N,N'-diacetyllegionaminate synthase
MGVLIIAEAGVNHNGSLKLAKELAQAAKAAGADAVKYQTFKAEGLVTRGAKTAEYQRQSVGAQKSQYQMLKELELSEDEFIELRSYCRDIGIQFCTTMFDPESTRFALERLDLPFIKIPSGEITNLPFLETVAAVGKPIILSTGMSTIDEVRAAVDTLRAAGSGEVTVLHCVSQYPAPFADVNLRAMVAMGEELGLPYGFSDHTRGIEASVAAVALGASVVEKHFTLSREMEGPDHKASLEPDELAALVSGIRHTEAALGRPEKTVAPSELANRDVVRKSIVAARHIDAGEVFSERNLTTKRPGTGLSPMRWHELIGTRALRSYEPDEAIEL